MPFHLQFIKAINTTTTTETFIRGILKTTTTTAIATIVANIVKTKVATIYFIVIVIIKIIIININFAKAFDNHLDTSIILLLYFDYFN